MRDMAPEKLIETLSKAALTPVCPECGGSRVDRSGGGPGERCPSCRHGTPLGQKADQQDGASA